MKTAKDAKQMERVIVAYHESLTPIKGTAVSAVVKGMCRIGEADYVRRAYQSDVLKQQQHTTHRRSRSSPTRPSTVCSPAWLS